MFECLTLPFVLLLAVMANQFESAPEREHVSEDWNTEENTEKIATFWNHAEPMEFPDVEWYKL